MFLPVGRSGGADQFGGLAEEGARAGGGDFTGGFAAAHHRARVSRFARLDRNRRRFAGEGGLVRQQRSLVHPHIRGHDAALAQMDDVAGHQFLRRQRGPRAVPANPRLHVQLLAQQRQRLLRAAFLQETQHRIQDEQPADHRRLHTLAEKELDDDRGLQKPGNGRPKPIEELLERMGLFLDDRIGAELLQPRLGLGRGQTPPILGAGIRTLNRRFHICFHYCNGTCPPPEKPSLQ